MDHIIISTDSYYSFKDSGLLAELELSVKYKPHHVIKEGAVKAAKKGHEQETKIQIATALKREGVDIKMIAKTTGLRQKDIKLL